MGDQEIQVWVSDLNARYHLDHTNVNEGKATLNVNSINQIDLQGVPENAVVVLQNVGAQNGHFLVVGDQGSLPAHLEIGGASTLSMLDFRSTWERPFQSAQLLFADVQSEVEIQGVPPRFLEIESATVKWAAAKGDGEVTLKDVALKIEHPWTVDRAILEGTVVISSHRFTARRATLVGATELGGNLVLGLIGSEEAPLIVRLEGQSSLSVESLPEATEVSLGGATLELRRAEEPIRSARISGPGEIQVRGFLSAPEFVGPAATLRVDPGAQVLEAKGRIILSDVRSVCTGDPRSPLVLEGVHSVSNAELEAVDLYELQLSDLEPLSNAERLTPSIPNPRKARQKEDKMMLGAKSEQLARRRRAHFWTRMSHILGKTHAPGALQSEVRFAAARCRRRALGEWGKEKILLTLYSLVGYGERIGRPLVLLFVTSLVTSLLIGPLEGPTSVIASPVAFLAKWWRVLLSPLAFFRVIDPPSVSGVAEIVSLLIYQLLGIVMLFFALSSIRRVAKAE